MHGAHPQRTDYLPAEVYRRHISEALKRGYKTFDDPHTLLVSWNRKFDLKINLRIAKVLGIELSPTVLARADEVIE